MPSPSLPSLKPVAAPSFEWGIAVMCLVAAQCARWTATTTGAQGVANPAAQARTSFSQQAAAALSSGPALSAA